MKKTMMFVAALAMVAFAAVSCKKGEAPKASFSYENDGLVVSFTNLSKNADSYKWEFGDGQTSTETNPKHTYADNGDYTVVLTATNQYGEKKYSEVVSLSVADFTITIDGDFKDWKDLVNNDYEALAKEILPAEGADVEGMREIYYLTDADYLYFFVVFDDAAEKNNSFGMYIDADADAKTGKDRSGYWSNIGADYLVEFGDASGADAAEKAGDPEERQHELWNDWSVFNVYIYPEGTGTEYRTQPVAKGKQGDYVTAEGKIMLSYFAGHGSLSSISRVGTRSCEPGWSKAGGLPAIIDGTKQPATVLKFKE